MRVWRAFSSSSSSSVCGTRRPRCSVAFAMIGVLLSRGLGVVTGPQGLIERVARRLGGLAERIGDPVRGFPGLVRRGLKPSTAFDAGAGSREIGRHGAGRGAAEDGHDESAETGLAAMS